MSPAAADERERADALVLFGITGDLAQKMLLPALYRLTRQGFLRERIIGVTRGGWSQDRLRAHAHDAVAAQGPVDEREFDRFADLLRLATVDYDTPADSGPSPSRPPTAGIRPTTWPSRPRSTPRPRAASPSPG